MLTEQMTDCGGFLFRWRSYLPLVIIPLVLLGLLHFHYPYHDLSLDRVWEGLCMIVIITGEAIRIATVGFVPKGTSGRNTRAIKADVLNTSGMYSIVRHPLYLGNFLIFVGLLMFTRSWAVVAVTSLLYWLYYERIMLAEEAFLLRTHGEQFQAWSARTPAVWPRLRQWTAPLLAFSWRSAVRREYGTCFMIICVCTAIEVGGDTIVHRHLALDPMWQIAFLVALAGYLALRSIKKWTHLLDSPGR